MKRSIQEQIDGLRNSIEWGLQNHPEMPIICREAADTMEALRLEVDIQCSSEYVEKILKHQEELRRVLQTLAWQHGWGRGIGKCVCAAHRKVEELGLRYDVPAKEDIDGS